MLKFTKQQVHGPLLADRPRLIADIIEHLDTFTPEVVTAYPPGYLRGIVNEGIKLGFSFGIDDVHSMRLFVRLRWDMAPGFYKEPRINAVLSQTNRPADERFDQLATSQFDAAWLDSMAFDGPGEWRGEILPVDEPETGA